MTIKKLQVVANIAIIIMLLTLCIGCCSGKPLAVLSIAKGNISISKTETDTFLQGSVGMKLVPGDCIHTNNDSTAVVTFFDGSAIELQPNTRLTLSSLGIEKSGATKILLKQTVGETISRVIKLVDPQSRYEIETISAIATVRGTTMIVNVVLNGLSSVGNEEGRASVIAEGVEVDVPEGSHSTVAPGRPPAEPKSGVRPIDSLLTDPRATVISDPCEDVAVFVQNKAGADLKTAWALMEKDYLYVAIQLCDTFDSSLIRNYFTDIYINNDELVDYSIGVRPYRIADFEAGQAWAIVYSSTTISDWHITDAPEVVAYWKLDSGLLEMIIPRKTYNIPDIIWIAPRSTDGNRDLDWISPFKLTLAEAE